MPTSVTMPALGESVTEGTVTRWLKQEGEQVEVDEPLLEVSTDKVDTEIPSPAAGVLSKILVAEDETVEVGAELAVIGGDGDGGAPAGQPASAEDATETPQTPTEQVQDTDAGAQPAQEPAPAQEQQPEPAQASGQGGSGGGQGTPVTMPALGESVTEGTVTRWLKSVGDEVTADEPLLEVSTDKVDTEIPAPVSGTLLSISVNEDETVDVGAELAVIGTGAAGGGAPAAAPAPQQQAAPAQQEAPAPQQAPAQQPTPEPAQAATATAQPGGDYGSSGAQPTQSPTSAPSPAAAVAPSAPAPQAGGGDGGGTYVTPLVRRLANEHGVDLSSISGTGVGGRIRKQDVLAAAEAASAPAPAAEPAAASAGAGRAAPKPSPAAMPDTSLRGRTEKLSRLRSVIARRMVESLAVSAQLTTVVEADVTAIARLRAQAKKDFEAR
jgi:pyruvate dehydrogenase E2 component (dihydrolipoamide acetyltransferase)